MQYSENVIENLVVKKQTATARTDEAARASMHPDPHILEENLAVEAIIDASHADAATRLAALNENSWSFLEDTTDAFEGEYNVFYQRGCAYLSSRVDMLVLGQDQATHHYEGCTHGVEASPSSNLKKPIVIDIFDNE
ncbi:hypothetical protein D1007_20795 [Hordeum vulgare]|nr:hypothetical protein D1007_20795 [Hordeum vulgare]